MARNERNAIEQSEHVLYEIQMLFFLLSYFRTREVDRAVAKLEREGLPARNAIVEAFQLHARSLIEFLVGKPRHGEARADDFTRSAWAVSETTRKALNRRAGEISQRVAHLSWQRSRETPEERLVRTEEIVDELRPHLRRFLDEADQDRLCGGFVEEVRPLLAKTQAADVANMLPKRDVGAITGATTGLGLSPNTAGTAATQIPPRPTDGD